MVHWKDFEQERLCKDCFRLMAATFKPPLPQLFSTNHSDCWLPYPSEASGNRNNSTSNPPCFMVNWKKKFTCDHCYGSLTETKYANLTDAYMDLSNLQTNGILCSLNSWPPKTLQHHTKTTACLSTTSSNGTYCFTRTTLQCIRLILPTKPLWSKIWQWHFRSRTLGKPNFCLAYIFRIHQTVLLLLRTNTSVLSSLNLE